MHELERQLRQLYSDTSKHSVYQNIPDFVSEELGYTESIDEAWRGDRPRYAYLLAKRTPAAGETWVDFGANTGFFTLSLARRYPETTFVAVEANPNHVAFIESVVRHFGLGNVEIVSRAIGLHELECLPCCDFLLHLNVLHHAGHDFDAEAVPNKDAFPVYARRYLELVRHRAKGMLFQLGSNWGGDKNQPLVQMQADAAKVRTFSSWLQEAGWNIETISLARRDEHGAIAYLDLPDGVQHQLPASNTRTCAALEDVIGGFHLDSFPGEFYRRPLFLCSP